jgi:hypothetical protein
MSPSHSSRSLSLSIYHLQSTKNVTIRTRPSIHLTQSSQGYQDCPNSSLYCYLPGDSLVGIESCYASSGSDSTDTSTTPSSTDSSVPTTDTCENGGLSCAYCFGEGNIACPQSDGYCYDPSNSTSICPEGVGSESGSSSGSASSETDSAAASGTSSPTTDDTESSVTPASGAGSTDTAGGIAGGSGDAEDQSSATSTRSGSSSSATSGSTSGQGSSAGNGNGNSNSNGSPVQNSNGHSVVREGLVGVLAAGGAAFVAAIHLRI